MARMCRGLMQQLGASIMCRALDLNCLAEDCEAELCMEHPHCTMHLNTGCFVVWFDES